MGSKGRGGNEIEGKVRRREWYGMRGHRRGGEGRGGNSERKRRNEIKKEF